MHCISLAKKWFCYLPTSRRAPYCDGHWDPATPLVNLVTKSETYYILLCKSIRSLLPVKYHNSKLCIVHDFCRSMLCKRCLSRQVVSVCLSVSVSVTFVHCVETNKRIFKFFSLSGSHTILVSILNFIAIF